MDTILNSTHPGRRSGSIRPRGEPSPVDTKREAQMTQSQRLESIGMLASGVAHELNNPIGIVMSLAQLILEDGGSTPESQGFAAIIKAESERMAGLVRNLLSFSRHNNESPHPADVRELIDKTLALMRATFRRDRIEVITEVPEGLPKIRCRGPQIQQVLMNLLTNAQDALNTRFPDASPDKMIRITVRSHERTGETWIRLTVEDRGIGVPPEVTNYLFDPFFTTKGEDKGTGLGLSISHGIMKEHGGRICFESRHGAGTRFHLDLKTDNGWLLREAMNRSVD